MTERKRFEFVVDKKNAATIMSLIADLVDDFKMSTVEQPTIVGKKTFRTKPFFDGYDETQYYKHRTILAIMSMKDFGSTFTSSNAETSFKNDSLAISGLKATLGRLTKTGYIIPTKKVGKEITQYEFTGKMIPSK